MRALVRSLAASLLAVSSLVVSERALAQCATVNETLDATPPAAGQTFTPSTGSSMTALFLNDAPSSCAVPKSNPGLSFSAPRQYDAYRFVNPTTIPQCYTISVTTVNANVVAAAVYDAGGFDPADASLNYLADSGSTQVLQNFSFTAAPGPFTLVVMEPLTGAGTGQSYSFVLNGPCGPNTLNVTRTLGSPGPEGTTGFQTDRLIRDGIVATCAAPKANPNVVDLFGFRQYDAYRVSNTTNGTLCYQVTATINSEVVPFTTMVVSYDANGFFPPDPSLNYLADPGSSPGVGLPQTFSVNVPAGGTFTIVVHEVDGQQGDRPGRGAQIGAFTTNYTLGTFAPGPPGVGGGTLSNTTVLTSNPNPSVVGGAVTFRARVVTGVPTPTATGTVQFREGNTVLGAGTLNLLSETTFTTSALTAGTHDIVAFYFGDVNFLPSFSGILKQVVSGLPASTTALTSSKNPAALGDAVTFTATVASSAGTPTGTVTFKDGAATLGSGTLSGGVATFTTSSLSLGSHPISAVYGGSGAIAGSTSSPLDELVVAKPTTTAVTSSLNPAGVGQGVTFTAAVTGAGGTPTGTVTFKDGATTLGTASLSSGSASLSTSSLIVGLHSITAVYGGDASFAASTSGVLAQTIVGTNGCATASPGTLCLQSNGRFQVRVTYTDQYHNNQTGSGIGTALTSDSGTFTFFSANNIELVIKILDGRAVNGKFWVLYGALSDVGYTVTVTDTLTGAVKTYVNPPGTQASLTDVNAFAGRPAAGAARSALADAPATYGQLASLQLAGSMLDAQKGPIGGLTAPAEGGACVTSGGTLCLSAGRFASTVTWKNYNDGSTGVGTATALTADSGTFWFFSAPNVELMVKVLDDRGGLTGKFWVAYGSLTDVEFHLTVTDSSTGASKTYDNPAHVQASKIDINAF